MDCWTVSEADLRRSREDLRFKQTLLAKSLEQLLGSMHKLQRSPGGLSPATERSLREGALMAVRLADLLHAIDERLQRRQRTG